MKVFDELLLGNSPELKEITNAAGIIAATDITTLICGESGTGKELIARGIHLSSDRSEGPFVSINCASLPEALAESLMFGHRKGAFTGALNDHIGYLRSADGGTLFLDEIAELPLNTQAKFLRFLESGECLPVGEVQARKPNVRVIAATHRDLSSEVRKGRFREDLFYRLNLVPLTLPPLRSRGRDMELLLEHFLDGASQRFGSPRPRFSREALKLMRNHDWPGNVRELRNLAERMAVLFSNREVDITNLPAEIISPPASGRNGVGESGFTLPRQGIVLDELEADIIRQALDRTAGNRSRAARLLGLTRDTLLYRLKKYSIA